MKLSSYVLEHGLELYVCNIAHLRGINYNMLIVNTNTLDGEQVAVVLNDCCKEQLINVNVLWSNIGER